MLLVVTIRFGIFTPTEVGAFAVVYTILVGTLVYGEMTIAKFREAVEESVVDTGVIMLIISMAAILSYVLAYGRVPASLSEAILAIHSSDVVIYAAVIGVLLFEPLWLKILNM